ncbi:MAG: deoxyguanosinetriphosphate triphosphohydrolase [Methylobacteriaceae bacterium]|nr:deoxyguanosinetriphosphate triphosphohydrolase [Methylobacteriaceae bacterium]
MQFPFARAAFAADPGRSRGRLVLEPSSPTRTEFQRDRDRVIHSTAFRRLAYKTQVFVPLDGDHYRTRLTHTIEVAQIARALARALALDEDLAEALALAHDLGHTPFGHTGEEALDACMAPYGGFDHNAHALRIVTRLERRYAGFDGLNLTWETLEGLVKHNGPLRTPQGLPAKRFGRRGIPEDILAYDNLHPLDLDTHASAEAQGAALADDIAYDAHDIDDGLRAGLFDLDDLIEVAFLRGLLDEIGCRHPGLERSRVIHELVRRIITRFVEDAIAESRKRLVAAAPADADGVRRAGGPLVGFSAEIVTADRSIKAFLYPRMYRHRRVVEERRMADRVVRACFARFMADPTIMPGEWAQAAAGGERVRARAVADYIAGMTDRYALKRFEELFDEAAELR